MARATCRVCGKTFIAWIGKEKTCPDCRQGKSLANKCKREEKIKARIELKKARIKKLEKEIKELGKCL